MADNQQIKPHDCPEINPMYLFRWEEAQKSYLLLYPEGIIKLNNSAAEIMKVIDGIRSLQTIIDELKALFETDDLDDDVISFMEMALAKGWIRLKS